MIHAISLILTSIVKDNIDNSRLLLQSFGVFIRDIFFLWKSLFDTVSGYGFLGIIAPIGGFIGWAWGLLQLGSRDQKGG
ncbi:MAG: hypothetical protein CM1200mP3_11230 [Chloroflexota bacterium]|nr:MAG: hypothetical protein CM1200mP3_11230 [Chloroflexota bacterium]